MKNLTERLKELIISIIESDLNEPIYDRDLFIKRNYLNDPYARCIDISIGKIYNGLYTTLVNLQFEIGEKNDLEFTKISNIQFYEYANGINIKTKLNLYNSILEIFFSKLFYKIMMSKLFILIYNYNGSMYNIIESCDKNVDGISISIDSEEFLNALDLSHDELEEFIEKY